MQVLLTSIGLTNFFRCLIFEFFFFTNADDLNKIRETNGGKIKKQDVPLTLDFPQTTMMTGDLPRFLVPWEYWG